MLIRIEGQGLPGADIHRARRFVRYDGMPEDVVTSLWIRDVMRSRS